jgi:hypothetical protein
MGSNIDKDIINYEGSEELMPFTLQTLTKKIEHVANPVNRSVVNQFYDYMTERDLSKNHKINNLKVVMSYADYLGPQTTFHNINKKEQIILLSDVDHRHIEFFYIT